MNSQTQLVTKPPQWDPKETIYFFRKGGQVGIPLIDHGYGSAGALTGGNEVLLDEGEPYYQPESVKLVFKWQGWWDGYDQTISLYGCQKAYIAWELYCATFTFFHTCASYPEATSEFRIDNLLLVSLTNVSKGLWHVGFQRMNQPPRASLRPPLPIAHDSGKQLRSSPIRQARRDATPYIAMQMKPANPVVARAGASPPVRAQQQGTSRQQHIGPAPVDSSVPPPSTWSSAPNSISMTNRTFGPLSVDNLGAGEEFAADSIEFLPPLPEIDVSPHATARSQHTASNQPAEAPRILPSEYAPAIEDPQANSFPTQPPPIPSSDQVYVYRHDPSPNTGGTSEIYATNPVEPHGAEQGHFDVWNLNTLQPSKRALRYHTGVHNVIPPSQGAQPSSDPNPGIPPPHQSGPLHSGAHPGTAAFDHSLNFNSDPTTAQQILPPDTIFAPLGSAAGLGSATSSTQVQAGSVLGTSGPNEAGRTADFFIDDGQQGIDHLDRPTPNEVKHAQGVLIRERNARLRYASETTLARSAIPSAGTHLSNMQQNWMHPQYYSLPGEGSSASFLLDTA
ncbi:hypothetical protein SISSUDRAFT_1066040 [Sistotremastrum suecicum HHB10207 ss-3]|uniref:Uncharacterized protein n=1 Tax=Sistotremastrum suecicum HHB10207 ss-3 TaxID=1314776 RepID=A0A165YSE4_9AGAM|nr:hypothetical protein SISSUDRAFT_1066040 [Sistotremastrum suecicum HHB10207 ss-3]